MWQLKDTKTLEGIGERDKTMHICPQNVIGTNEVF